MTRKKILAKERLLTTGEKLMLLKGYNATGIDDVCKTAKTTKGGFYHYFKDKEDFAVTLLEQYLKNMKQHIQTASFHKKTDPLERVYSWIDYFIAIALNPRLDHSCLIGNLTQEVATTSPLIRKTCDAAFNELSHAFEKDLKLAKLQYSRKKVNTQELSDYFIASIQGSLLLAKAKGEALVNKTNLLHFKKYIQLLFNTH